MAVTSPDHQRAHLLSLLWSLKRAIDRAPHGSIPGVSYIHFNALRNDDVYRADVLEKAMLSQVEEIRTIAEEIRTIEAEADQAAAAPAHEPADVNPFAHAEIPPPPQAVAEPRARRGISGLTTIAFALALTGLVVGGYWASESRLMDHMSQLQVSGSLTEDKVWHAGKTYHLDGLVFVEGNATLTIEPGVRILGEPGSALIVTRDARINARGTVDEPIVFTSAKPEGERARGDWGGVVLLGNAPVNTPVAHIEGVDEDDPRGAFGGSDASESCGILQYVRIEFAGHEISKDNELNGLTLGGCGSGTILRYVQVHMGLDDGVELFGGSANLSHVVISRAGDDGLDWDRGWKGNGQFIVIQQDDRDGDNGIEADNLKSNPNAEPRSAPTISNLTIVNGGDPVVAQRGMTLRRGTGADLRNVLLAGFSADAIDVRDVATVEQTVAGTLRTEAVVFTEPAGAGLFESETGEADDDGGFDEAAFFQNASTSSVFIQERVLPRAAHDRTAPDFTPSYNEALMRINAPIPQGEFWDEAANYVGAIRPGSRSTWLDRWTSFPDG